MGACSHSSAAQYHSWLLPCSQRAAVQVPPWDGTVVMGGEVLRAALQKDGVDALSRHHSLCVYVPGSTAPVSYQD